MHQWRTDDVATWHHGTLRPKFTNSENKCRLASARPLTMPNFIALWQKICEISAVKNLLPKKWTKVHQNHSRRATHQCPHHAKFHRSLSNRVREKRYKFLNTIILGPQGDSWAKVHQSGWWGTASSPLSICQISSHFDNPSTRYLPPNFVNFLNGVTQKKAKKKQKSKW